MKYEFHCCWTVLRNSLHNKYTMLNSTADTNTYNFQRSPDYGKYHNTKLSDDKDTSYLVSRPPQHNPCKGEVFPASCSQWEWPSPSLPHHSEWEKKLSEFLLFLRSTHWELFQSRFSHYLAKNCKREHLVVAPYHPAGPSGLIPSRFTSLLPVNQTPELPHHLPSWTFCAPTTLTHLPNHLLPSKPLHSVPLSTINKHSCYGWLCPPNTFTQIHTWKSSPSVPRSVTLLETGSLPI